jgi:hypothetical protein
MSPFLGGVGSAIAGSPHRQARRWARLSHPATPHAELKPTGQIAKNAKLVPIPESPAASAGDHPFVNRIGRFRTLRAEL